MPHRLLLPCLAVLCLMTACKEETVAKDAPQEIQADSENDIRERYWKLVELNGQPVKPHNNEAHIILKTEGNRVAGSGGCNRIMGGYELQDMNRIRFTQMASTRMACSDGMDTEQEFLKVLESADNYTMNGDTLSLNRARMAPLARFEAVYLQ